MVMTYCREKIQVKIRQMKRHIRQKKFGRKFSCTFRVGSGAFLSWH